MVEKHSGFEALGEIDVGAHDFTVDTDVLFVDSTNDRVGIRTDSPSEDLEIIGNGKITQAYIGPQSLNEPNFTTHAKWDVTGDFDDTGGNATWLHNTGEGDLTQTAANMAVPFVANTVYEFIYTVSAVTKVGMLMATAYDHPSGDYANLDLTPGIHSVLLTSAAVPGDFKILALSDTEGDGFTLDDFSLKSGGGGEIITDGDATIGGRALITGDVGIGTTTPSEKLKVVGNILATVNIYAGSTLSAPAAEIAAWETINGLTGNTLIVDTDVLVVDATNDRVGIGTTTPGSKLAVVGLPIYANNAAAITGGFAAGDFYRTGADPDVVCVVH